MAKRKRPYIEKNCVFTGPGGRKYESGGAMVTNDRIVAYLGKEGKLTNWHGKKIGSYQVTSSWKNPRGIYSDRNYQVDATVGGVKYTGRSGGVGMAFTGKRRRRQ